MTAPPLARVELVEHERVMGRGAARVYFLVKKGDGWLRATEWPGAQTESRDAGPGTVWERAVILELPVGTEVSRVEVRPREPRRLDPLSHLMSRASAAPRTTRRVSFRVKRDGRLAPTR